MRHFTLLPILALALGAATPALANHEAVSVPVSIADLDLSNPADADRLRTRLNRAASAACEVVGEAGLEARAAFNGCRQNALQTAALKADRVIAAANVGGGAQIRTARR
ncbi:MAG TPA: UrcA family protein [Sphingomonadaceae bacterium]|nr:UrcA family protein [Sphingomonadaceae bacterium]